MQTLPKCRRISDQRDFDASKKLGKRFHSKDFFLVKSANALDFSRVAVVASRKAGNAVKRNYWRRSVKDCFRKIELQPADYIMILKPSVKQASKLALKSQIEALFLKHLQ